MIIILYKKENLKRAEKNIVLVAFKAYIQSGIFH